MIRAARILNDWFKKNQAILLKNKITVELKPTHDTVELNKANILFKKSSISLSITIWGTGMVSTIYYDQLSDTLISNDNELNNKKEILQHIESSLASRGFLKY